MKTILKLLIFCFVFFACNTRENKANEQLDSKSEDSMETYQPQPYVELKHPEWSKNATIYEVNLRQYTAEGTFKAFEGHLPRLKEMGIDIIWLMPIHPIGEKNRKGKMGSYYAVKDYYGINPEFGTEEDFQNLVDKIHDMGMYVILDWVANHSAWDNPLVQEHPEWYTKTKDGNFQPTPWYDWDDIIDFDYDQPGIRKYMTQALEHWVSKYNIDGYRCDVAGFMPLDFWNNARRKLDAIKSVFMLAEWESRDLHKSAFDMTYSWSLWNKLHDVTVGGKPINGLVEYMAHDVSTFPNDGYRMTFIDNHDKNSWEGNPFLNFGEGLETSMVMAATVSGMPLVYSGQEAGLNRSLKFFDKDTIQWKDHKFFDIYKTLFDLKHNNKALWNGKAGGQMVRIYSDQMDKIISFSREKDDDQVISIFNFSNESISVNLMTENFKGTFTDVFSGKIYKFKGKEKLTVQPWGYLVLVN